MTESHSSLIQLIEKTIPLNAADHQTLIHLFDEQRFSKNSYLIREGQHVQYLYFVVTGFLRNFYLSEGKEITTHIHAPHQFASVIQAYVSHDLSPENLVGVTEGILLRISRENLEKLCHQEPKWASLGQIIYQHSLAIQEVHNKNLLTLNGEERYLNLIENNPQLVQAVPLHYLASYIGLTPESLSRIRKKIIS